MLFLEPTVHIRSIHTRELCLLLDRYGGFHLTLPQMDDLVIELRGLLVKKEAYIQKLVADHEAQNYDLEKEDDAQMDRSFLLYIRSHQETADRYRRGLNTLFRYRLLLIEMTEAGWAVEEKYCYGLDEGAAIEVSTKRERKRNQNRALDKQEPERDVAYQPPSA